MHFGHHNLLIPDKRSIFESSVDLLRVEYTVVEHPLMQFNDGEHIGLLVDFLVFRQNFIKKS